MTPLNMAPNNGRMNETPEAILSRVRVASPCMESWEAMPGGERVRACERCRHKVYNLSAMTAEEAAKLVREAEGRVCVRFYRRADGTMMTQDCPVGLRAVRLRIGSIISAAVASMSLFFGFAFSNKSAGKPTIPVETSAPVETVPLMGAVAPTPPVETAPTMGEVAPAEVMGDMAIERPIMGKVVASPELGRVAIKKNADQ